MQITINPFGEWRRVATIEVSSRVKDLPVLVRDETLKFRLVEADSPRRTFQRFDLVVDSTEGEHRCARTARAVLGAMREAASHGCIEDYRVIEGNEWLVPQPATISYAEHAIVMTQVALKKTRDLLSASANLLDRSLGLSRSADSMPTSPED